mmetsp:Transcript_2456/g.5482  ORF Transcript_2456/g.5482 Transcript_2456/m.5482 type:complete len:84 (+) Transcript_2456:687-938(+)
MATATTGRSTGASSAAPTPPATRTMVRSTRPCHDPHAAGWQPATSSSAQQAAALLHLVLRGLLASEPLVVLLSAAELHAAPSS